MKKYFTYYGVELAISPVGFGQYLIEGQSGCYEGATATTTDAEIYDYCDSDDREAGRWARRAAYHAIKK